MTGSHPKFLPIARECENGQAPPPRSEAERGGGRPYPCLSSNNCNESVAHGSPSTIENRLNLLTGNHKKTAEALRQNIQIMVDRVGIKHVVCLDLTVPDKGGVSPGEFQRRYKSLCNGLLNSRYGSRIRVLERGGKNGRLHAHLLIEVGFDASTGTDWEKLKVGDYRGANPTLRQEWKFLLSTLKKYGFGRFSMLPIRSTAEGIAFYVGKYVSKHIDCRREEDKGIRLVEYGQGARHWNSRFAWHSEGAKAWRGKTRAVGSAMGITEEGDMHKALGRRWCWKYRMFFVRTILGPIPSDQDWKGITKEIEKEMIRLAGLGQKFFLSPAEAAVEIGLKATESNRAKNGVKGIMPLRGAGGGAHPV